MKFEIIHYAKRCMPIACYDRETRTPACSAFSAELRLDLSVLFSRLSLHLLHQRHFSAQRGSASPNRRYMVACTCLQWQVDTSSMQSSQKPDAFTHKNGIAAKSLRVAAVSEISCKQFNAPQSRPFIAVSSSQGSATADGYQDLSSTFINFTTGKASKMATK